MLGLEPSTGRTRWSYPLPKPKLTNVPTPIALSDNRLLLSGQGCDGTRMLVIELVEGEERVKELWVQRKAQFFYTNWATDGQAAYGFTGNGGKRLTALSLLDGKILSQDMGQTDAQVVCDGKQLLLVRSDGVVSLANTTADGIEADLKAQPLKDRCWAAPTIVDDTVILRTATEITRFPLAKLSKDFKPPVDSGVSALDAAYGQPSGKK